MWSLVIWSLADTWPLWEPVNAESWMAASRSIPILQPWRLQNVLFQGHLLFLSMLQLVWMGSWWRRYWACHGRWGGDSVACADLCLELCTLYWMAWSWTYASLDDVLRIQLTPQAHSLRSNVFVQVIGVLAVINLAIVSFLLAVFCKRIRDALWSAASKLSLWLAVDCVGLLTGLSIPFYQTIWFSHSSWFCILDMIALALMVLSVLRRSRCCSGCWEWQRFSSRCCCCPPSLASEGSTSAGARSVSSTRSHCPDDRGPSTSPDRPWLVLARDWKRFRCHDPARLLDADPSFSGQSRPRLVNAEPRSTLDRSLLFAYRSESVQRFLRRQECSRLRGRFWALLVSFVHYHALILYLPLYLMMKTLYFVRWSAFYFLEDGYDRTVWLGVQMGAWSVSLALLVIGRHTWQLVRVLGDHRDC